MIPLDRPRRQLTGVCLQLDLEIDDDEEEEDDDDDDEAPTSVKVKLASQLFTAGFSYLIACVCF